MTQPVPTNGFIQPPPAGNPAPTGQPPLPPQELKPGFVPQNQPVPAAPNPAPAPAAAPDMLAAIAALQASLTAQAPAASTAPAQAAPNGSTVLSGVSDDPILLSMATMLQTTAKGLDLDRVMGNAIDRGDASLIDVAYLKEVAGDNSANLLLIAQGMVKAINTKAQGIENEVHALAGSQANWDACSAAFSAKAAPELKVVIATMLDSGKEAQIKAAAKLVVEFAKSTGYVPTGAGLVSNGGAAPLTGQGLSKAEFQEELRKLNPNTRDYEERRGDLYARRQAGKQAGK